MELVIDATVKFFAFLAGMLWLLLCQVICTVPHIVLDRVLAVCLQDKPIMNVVAPSTSHQQLACVVVVMTIVVVVRSVVVVMAFVVVVVAFVVVVVAFVVVVVAFVVVVMAFVVVMAAVVTAMVNYGDLLGWVW